MKNLYSYLGTTIVLLHYIGYAQTIPSNNKPLWVKEYEFKNIHLTNPTISSTKNNIFFMLSGPFGVGAYINKLDHNGNTVASFNELRFDTSGTKITYHDMLCHDDGSVDIYGAKGRYTYIASTGMPVSFFSIGPCVTRFDPELKVSNVNVAEVDTIPVNYWYTVDSYKRWIYGRAISQGVNVYTRKVTLGVDSILDEYSYRFKPVRTRMLLNVSDPPIVQSNGSILRHMMTEYDTVQYLFANYLHTQQSSGTERTVRLPGAGIGILKELSETEFYYSSLSDYGSTNILTKFYKINNNGIIQYEKSILPNSNIKCYLQFITKDSGCVMVGSVYSVASSKSSITDTCQNAAIVRLDKNGNVVWSDVYGIDGVNESFHQAIQLHDGSIAVSGYGNGKRMLLRYMDKASSQLGVTELEDDLLPVRLNADATVLTLHSDTEVSTENVTIFDMIGNPVAHGVMQQSTSTINVSHLSSGMYVAVLKNGNNQKRAKFMISR